MMFTTNKRKIDYTGKYGSKYKRKNYMIVVIWKTYIYPQMLQEEQKKNANHVQDVFISVFNWNMLTDTKDTNILTNTYHFVY